MPGLVSQHGYNDLPENIEPLSAHFCRQPRKTGRVSARTGEAGHDAGSHRITDGSENDWDGVGRMSRGERGRRRECDNHIHIQANQFGGKRVKSFELAFSPSGLNSEVTAFHVTKFPQPRADRVDEWLRWRAGLKQAQTPELTCLLRARRERPRRRAAECGQQFPPSDGDCHTPLPREVRKME